MSFYDEMIPLFNFKNYEASCYTYSLLQILCRASPFIEYMFKRKKYIKGFGHFAIYIVYHRILLDYKSIPREFIRIFRSIIGKLDNMDSFTKNAHGMSQDLMVALYKNLLNENDVIKNIFTPRFDVAKKCSCGGGEMGKNKAFLPHFDADDTVNRYAFKTIDISCFLHPEICLTCGEDYVYEDETVYYYPPMICLIVYNMVNKNEATINETEITFVNKKYKLHGFTKHRVNHITAVLYKDEKYYDIDDISSPDKVNIFPGPPTAISATMFFYILDDH